MQYTWPLVTDLSSVQPRSRMILWRGTRSPDLRMASLVLASVLVNPHLYVYDLVVLAVPLALAAAWAIQNRGSRPAPLPWRRAYRSEARVSVTQV